MRIFARSPRALPTNINCRRRRRRRQLPSALRKRERKRRMKRTKEELARGLEKTEDTSLIHVRSQSRHVLQHIRPFTYDVPRRHLSPPSRRMVPSRLLDGIYRPGDLVLAPVLSSRGSIPSPWVRADSRIFFSGPSRISRRVSTSLARFSSRKYQVNFRGF